MATIKDKVDARLNDTFTENLREYLSGEFPGVKFESHCWILSGGVCKAGDGVC